MFIKIFKYTLPMPPSINVGMTNGVKGRHIYTEATKAWKKNAAKELMVARVQQSFTTLKVPSHCRLDFHFSNVRCDLNNYLKFLYDVLTESALIKDDRYIYSEFHNKLMTDKGKERVDIYLSTERVAHMLYEDEIHDIQTPESITQEIEEFSD